MPIQPPDTPGAVPPAEPSAPSLEKTQTLGPSHLPLGSGQQDAPKSWGHLRIRDRLGAGGFGEVYRAWDDVLEREVALKLLHREIGGQINLKSEGRLLAKLRHPNVMTVYGLAEYDGRVGLWGELLSGRTLAELMKQQGRFGAEEAAAIGKEICRALAAAHASRLLHRDVKAGNVMREDGGRIVLLDFGLGVEKDASKAGGPTPMGGTPLYMAPELFGGEEATVQSDIYAVGVLLFHLVTGSYPVEGRTLTELREAHGSGRRRILSDVRPDLPENYVQAVTRAIAPRPADRFQSVGELLQALSGQPHGDRLAAPPVQQTRRSWFWPALVLAAGLIAAVLSLVQLGGPGWFGTQKASIAVLPFNTSGPQPDNEYLADGIAEELVNELARADNLRVVARTSTLSFKGGGQNLSEIGAKLRVASLLTGGVRRIGDRLRVSVQLVRASDSTQIWSEAFDHDVKDVFTMQQEISKAVARVLRVRLAGGARPQVNSNAYTLFLQGNFFLGKGSPANLTRAIDYFNAALREEPDYARAYAGLARAHIGLARQNGPSPEVMAKAKDAVNRALRLDDRLAEAHAALGYLKGTYEWDWRGAETAFKRALECDPKAVDARLLYAGLLINMERTSDAWVQLRQAEELDPLSPAPAQFESLLLYLERRYAESERQIRKTLANSPEQSVAHVMNGLVAFKLGKNEEALQSFRRSYEIAKSPISKAGLGWSLGRSGHVEEARRMLQELEADAHNNKATPLQVALVASGLGESDTSFHWLDEAIRMHDPTLAQIRITPMFEGLRKDPRFNRVIERVGLNIPR